VNAPKRKYSTRLQNKEEEPELKNNKRDKKHFSKKKNNLSKSGYKT
jgi:hypothetical protein